MLNLPDLSGKRILVTGAAGFLGRHLLPRLLAAGAAPVCLIRSRASLAKLPPGVETCHGDCRDPEAMRKAAKGCAIIIHMAATLFGRNWQDYLAANSLSARNAALAAGNAEKLIFISSLAAAGPCARSPGRSEDAPAKPVSAYGWSKLLAEQILATRLPPDTRLATLRPPIIYGSGDFGLLPLFKSCKRGFGLNPGMRPFPVSMVHADDAARAICLACQPKAAGIYHLSDGHAYNMDDVCRAIGQSVGRKKITVLKPPLALMGMAAWLSLGADGFWNALRKLAGARPGKPPLWNPDKYREARQEGWLADDSKISRELGFMPQMTLHDGLAEAVRGYRKDGLL